MVLTISTKDMKQTGGRAMKLAIKRLPIMIVALFALAVSTVGLGEGAKAQDTTIDQVMKKLEPPTN